MKILVTGQVGLDKREYLREVEDIAQENEDKIFVSSVGQKMIELHNTIIGGNINDENILNLPRNYLTLLRHYAFTEIFKEADKFEGIHILNTHTVFRWGHNLIVALEIDIVKQYQPDLVVTLVDDIDRVKYGLIKRKTPSFSLLELLHWREEEIHFTKYMALAARRELKSDLRFYILPKAQGGNLFYKLIAKGNTPKVYLSFPATGIDEATQNDVNNFKRKFFEKFIAFDPLAIKEREIVNLVRLSDLDAVEDISRFKKVVKETAEKINSHHADDSRWKFQFNDQIELNFVSFYTHDGVEIDGTEVSEIAKAIDGQIVTRDRLLVEQADFLLFYIPVKDKKAQISAGSQTEIIHAYDQGKPVYGICSDEKALSPFVTHFSKVFSSLQEAFDFLVEEYLPSESKL